MNLTRFIQEDFTFECWIPVVDQQNLISWTKSKDGTGMIYPRNDGSMLLFCKEGMNPTSAIRNLKDKAGNLVFMVDGKAYQMYVTAVTPQFSAQGILDGYSHTLRNTLLPASVAALRNV